MATHIIKSGQKFYASEVGHYNVIYPIEDTTISIPDDIEATDYYSTKIPVFEYPHLKHFLLSKETTIKLGLSSRIIWILRP